MRDCGLRAAEAPAEPNTGAATVLRNCPLGKAYVPPKYRMAIAIVVYSIPMIPTREKGAKLARFFMRQSGSNTIPVTPNSDCVRVAAMPTVASKLVTVSAKIIEYDKFPNQQSMKHEKAMMNDVDFPTVASQASAYDIVFVLRQTRPINPKVYAEMTPINVMSTDAGIIADGALPNATTPAGKLSTPAPTILLIKLKTSLGIVAVPPPEVAPLPPAPPPRGTAASAPSLFSAPPASAEAEALPKVVVEVREADLDGDHNEDEDLDNSPLCLGAKAKQWLWLDRRSSPKTTGRTIMVKDGLLDIFARLSKKKSDALVALSSASGRGNAVLSGFLATQL
mmetsp:Transcript_57359/g.139940  ORF Transcript_57359/g.139940 Transcript_57359/m.139940 type:complete len:337 (+) Transcript_57359:680-1690(+)